jgi:ketosteroid isomerase-like protein
MIIQTVSHQGILKPLVRQSSLSMKRRLIMKKPIFVAILVVVCLFPVLAQTAAEKELIKVENDWNTASINRDTKALELLYATEYNATDFTGKTYTKAEDLKNVVDPKNVFASGVLSNLKVHVYGQTAIVTGVNAVKATYDGKDMSGDYRFTDVFVKRDGRWQCVATQGTKVVKN